MQNFHVTQKEIAHLIPSVYAEIRNAPFDGTSISSDAIFINWASTAYMTLKSFLQLLEVQAMVAPPAHVTGRHGLLLQD